MKTLYKSKGFIFVLVAYGASVGLMAWGVVKIVYAILNVLAANGVKGL